MGDPSKSKSSQRDANLAADERPVPSQAEGDRDTIEEDLAEKKEGSANAASGRPVPSQAEGDRETIEEDLAEKKDTGRPGSSGNK